MTKGLRTVVSYVQCGEATYIEPLLPQTSCQFTQLRVMGWWSCHLQLSVLNLLQNVLSRDK